MKSMFSVTFAMISYNDGGIIEDCLRSIRSQDYRGKVDILIIDGGSTDNTIDIAKNYKAIIISKPELKNFPNKRVEMIPNHTTSDIVVFVSADNRLQESNFISLIIKPFLEDDISAVETLHYGLTTNENILTQYFALIGGTDPIAIDLGKADRLPYDCKKPKIKTYSDNGDYYNVMFESNINRIPTLGANGFAIRGKLLKKFKMKNGLHIEMCVKMIYAGYNKFAFVKNAHIIHMQDGLYSFIKRKILWAELYSNNNVKRDYLVYNPRTDLFKLSLIVLSNITLIFPTIRAIKGYFAYRNSAWFLNPILCLIFTLSYTLMFLKHFLQCKLKPARYI